MFHYNDNIDNVTFLFVATLISVKLNIVNSTGNDDCGWAMEPPLDVWSAGASAGIDGNVPVLWWCSSLVPLAGATYSRVPHFTTIFISCGMLLQLPLVKSIWTFVAIHFLVRFYFTCWTVFIVFYWIMQLNCDKHEYEILRPIWFVKN